ncbi:MAG: rod shape-determining protein MreD [Ignavibacteriae bacterium]|nr:rod shape-determining protein MreD [Ignavibacteriota bacterium]
MRRIVLYLLISVLLIILHTTLMKYLAIGDIVPDILVVWIVYVAIRDGQLAGTVTGFSIGLAIDLMSGVDGMLGLSTMAKTVCGFAGGYFFNENKTFQTLGSWRYIVAIVVTSLLHNVIYFIIFLQGTPIGWSGAVLRYGIPTTAYSAAFALLPMFVFLRKYSS